MCPFEVEPKSFILALTTFLIQGMSPILPQKIIENFLVALAILTLALYRACSRGNAFSHVSVAAE